MKSVSILRICLLLVLGHSIYDVCDGADNGRSPRSKKTRVHLDLPKSDSMKLRRGLSKDDIDSHRMSVKSKDPSPNAPRSANLPGHRRIKSTKDTANPDVESLAVEHLPVAALHTSNVQVVVTDDSDRTHRDLLDSPRQMTEAKFKVRQATMYPDVSIELPPDTGDMKTTQLASPKSRRVPLLDLSTSPRVKSPRQEEKKVNINMLQGDRTIRLPDKDEICIELEPSRKASTGHTLGGIGHLGSVRRSSVASDRPEDLNWTLLVGFTFLGFAFAYPFECLVKNGYFRIRFNYTKYGPTWASYISTAYMGSQLVGYGVREGLKWSDWTYRKLYTMHLSMFLTTLAYASFAIMPWFAGDISDNTYFMVTVAITSSAGFFTGWFHSILMSLLSKFADIYSKFMLLGQCVGSMLSSIIYILTEVVRGNWERKMVFSNKYINILYSTFFGTAALLLFIAAIISSRYIFTSGYFNSKVGDLDILFSPDAKPAEPDVQFVLRQAQAMLQKKKASTLEEIEAKIREEIESRVKKEVEARLRAEFEERMKVNAVDRYSGGSLVLSGIDHRRSIDTYHLSVADPGDTRRHSEALSTIDLSDQRPSTMRQDSTAIHDISDAISSLESKERAKLEKDNFSSIKLYVNIEYWIHFICYPYIFSTIQSNSAYTGDLFNSRLFCPFAFLLQSIGELLGRIMSFFPKLRFSNTKLLLIAIPILSGMCIPVFIFSYRISDQVRHDLTLFCPWSGDNNIATNTSNSNITAPDIFYYDKELSMRDICRPPPKFCIPDALYLVSTTWSGLLHGYWTGFVPSFYSINVVNNGETEYGYAKGMFTFFEKLGQIFGASSSFVFSI
jgi:hypothetical protein